MKYITQNKYWGLVQDYNIDKLLYLLIDRPDRTRNQRSVYVWFKSASNLNYNNYNQDHRDYDFPSFIADNNLFWCVNNKKHRENNKPAKIRINGEKEYYIDGIFIKEEI